MTRLVNLLKRLLHVHVYLYDDGKHNRTPGFDEGGVAEVAGGCRCGKRKVVHRQVLPGPEPRPSKWEF